MHRGIHDHFTKKVLAVNLIDKMQTLFNKTTKILAPVSQQKIVIDESNLDLIQTVYVHI